MAGIERFMIAPLSSGLQTNLKPWLIPDDAFEELRNAYIFRGRIIKRFGAELLQASVTPTVGFEQLQSRLRLSLGTTNAITGNFTAVVPGTIFEIGQMFSIGNQLYTVYQVGTPANMLNTGAGTATYDTSNGTVTITGATPATLVYFYPAQPVMGLISYQQAGLPYEPLIAFDTQFAYQVTASGFDRAGTALWTGSDTNFFWGTNWRGLTNDLTYLYVTNYHFGTTLTNSDPMYYWDGANWNIFQPIFNSAAVTNTILTARIIVPFKDRLVLLNVVENTGAAPGTNKTYVNRCRFSWNGDPTNTTAFYEDIPGKGGYIDAPTKEAIVTAQFLKDRLIVYFTESTWELVYTGNQILPFTWQQINTELGAESTFSQIPFDKAVLGIGNVGIHACNGSNVERIDQNIPDTVFSIHLANQGPQRVYGIRDYFAETVYWSFPFVFRSSTSLFNNQVLVYNYRTGSWAINDDSITVFGYYQSVSILSDTWENTLEPWETMTVPWTDVTFQSQFKNIVAGNQEGFVFMITSEGGDDTGGTTTNSQSLQITNIDTATATFTVINHNLEESSGDRSTFIKITNCQGMTDLNGVIVKINKVIDENTFNIIDTSLTGAYTGGGTITRVTPPSIITKQYNFYVQEGRNTYVSKVDFLVTRTTNGEFTVDFATSSSDESLIAAGNLNGSIVGTSIVETSPYALIPQEQNQARLWHPLYLLADGECIQLRIYLNDEQSINPNIVESAFEIHAMTFYCTRTSSRLQ